jgi:hypothetical protein
LFINQDSFQCNQVFIIFSSALVQSGFSNAAL